MKSKLSLALGILTLGLLTALTAIAEEKTFEQFVVDIPADWKTEFKSGDNDGFGANLFISKEDQSAMISYTLERLSSGQWESMIKDMTDNPKPDTGPAQINSDKNFLVTFTDSKTGASGKETYYRVSDDMYVKEVTIGYDPEMNGILQSFQVQQGRPGLDLINRSRPLDHRSRTLIAFGQHESLQTVTAGGLGL